VKKLAAFLKPYRFSAAGAVLLVFLHSIADLMLPRLMARIVDGGIVAGDRELILRVGALMLAIAVLGSAAAVLSAFLSAKSALGFGRDLREAVFARAEGFSLAEFDAAGTSTLITRTTNDVMQVQGVVHTGMHMLARAPLMAVGGFALAFATDARLALALLAALPFLIGTIVLIARKGLPLFSRVQERTDVLGRVLREGLPGIRVVRAVHREDAERERCERANAELSAGSLSAQRTMATLMPALNLVMNLATVAVVWFGGRQVADQSLRIGSLMAFLQYATHILFSLMILSNLFVMLPRAQVAAGRVLEVLETESSIKDPAHPELPDASARGGRAGAGGGRPAPGRVEFRNVSFRYAGAEEAALEDVSFVAEAGKTTAIIGGTGAGKSTMLSLVPRFYDVGAGAVLVDGLDVRRWSQESLRERLGFVPQKAVLFTGSVAGNIAYGCPGAPAERLRRAAETAQAAEFIDSLPEGYESAVAQGGANFSGGQKQRLSIARALARLPEIYLFDDSFSALDFRTDARLRAALAREAAGATVIVVAQRVGTVMDADRIVVLDEGRVVGIGVHAELLETCPVYREIADSQLSAKEAV